ncbi:hypothetical protein [Streptomyces sp. CB02959]|uniref:hypothetical protein n=1 Tax=Streptomyces sp. CB02959 TaxID=2020330 RepID=UPI001C608414|nr:hypothetical protein [Streptomyces sp. CB02959]
MDTTPNPRLARDLAHGLVELIHPLGDIKTRIGAVQFASTIRRMVDELHQAGFSGGVEDLTKPIMLKYWMAVTGVRVQRTRGLLQGCGTRVDPALREYLDGRAVKMPPVGKPLEPYTEGEWQRIESALQGAVRQIFVDHGEVLALAKLGPDGHDDRQVFAWLLLNRGPLKLADAAREMGVSVDAFRNGVGAQYVAMRAALFPDVAAVYRLRILLGVYCGVVADGIRDLGLEDFTWAGDRTLLMDYIKNRRGPEGVNLSSRAVRLLERWLELSAPLRRFAPPESADHLWIFRAQQHVPGQPRGRLGVLSPITAHASGHKARQRIPSELGLMTDAGEPLQLHAGRIRTTYHNMLARRGWTGRTKIDPNHTTGVEGSHYVSTTTPAQAEAVETIIEDAQSDILRRARPATVLTETEAAEFAASRPEELPRLGLDEGAMAELLGGEMDVFTAACANQLAGLHGPKGKPCPARPWVCLLCPLSVFMPRHAPNLLRLKAYFSRQSRRMTVDQFLAVFGPYADRLDHEILPRFAPAVLEAASLEVADDDQELPLRPEEATA